MSKEIEKMELNEYCDKKRAKWVLENFEKIGYRTITSINYDPITKIKEYLNEILQSKDGYVKREYISTNQGRFFLKEKNFGYQSMMREFRQTLSKEDYYDLDIVNCQPNAIYQYCVKNKIKCKTLENYVENRDDIIKKYIEKGISKDEIKMEIIIIMYGGEISSKFDDDEFLENFYNEMQIIQKKILEKNKNIETKVKNKKSYNIKGSVCSYLGLQHVAKNLIIFDNFIYKKHLFYI